MIFLVRGNSELVISASRAILVGMKKIPCVSNYIAYLSVHICDANLAIATADV